MGVLLNTSVWASHGLLQSEATAPVGVSALLTSRRFWQIIQTLNLLVESKFLSFHAEEAV
jgi:hypothetical protein